MSSRQSPTPTNASLLIPYALPLLMYVGIASVPEEWGLSQEWNYALRLVATTAALAWGWRRFVPLRGPRPALGSIGVGVVAGLAGTALWVAIKSPFYPPGGEPWPQAAFALRLAASGSVVALFEELLFRGYALRLVVQWDRARRAGVSDPFTEAFDRASIAYGLLMVGLWIARKDLLTCVVAHGVTNVSLALYVHATGAWNAW